MSLQYLLKQVRDEVVFFCMQINIQVPYTFVSTLWVYKVSYKLTVSFLMGMIKHSQSTQINKFAISLQYLKKEIRKGIHFLHLDKHQIF